MTPERTATLIETYRDGLLRDTLPFWIQHGVDHEYGGFFTSLDRDGSVLDTDKSIWAQGRFTWLLATLYDTIDQRSEWLELAECGIRFLQQHAFHDDGRMFFQVTREGRPVRMRRYVYSEAFAAMAFAAYAKVTDDQTHADRAGALFDQFTRYSFEAGLIPPKTDPETRPMKSIGPLMITINVAQVLRETIGYEHAESWIDRCIAEIERDFLKRDLQAVMETVGPDGAVIDHFDGRLLNPGHAIEAAWFVLHESRTRGGDAALTTLGTDMLDCMWARGWDAEFGGIFYFRDLDDRPVQEYWHDMKFWWPHNEAIIATLLAHVMTGEQKYERWHHAAHDWAHDHFPDSEFGEWFGYLHRDARLSVPLKGNLWKGPFHVPRMQWYCWRLLEETCRQ